MRTQGADQHQTATETSLAVWYPRIRELERMKPLRADKPATLPPIALIGPGRVGGSLARAAAAAGLSAPLIGRGKAAGIGGSVTAALLCVPDSEIREASETTLAAAPELAFIGHTSGAGTLDALASRPDVSRFSLHPLQTIPDRRANLDGAPAAVAGTDGDALALAAGFAEALGMRPFEVPDEVRSAYHASASIASNFLVALEESACELLTRAGVEAPLELLAPLVLRTAENWAERGADALTGPIARGDEATVARHTAAIEDLHPELLVLYAALAARTRELVARTEGAAA